MIYTINTKGFLLYPVAKSYFEMSDENVYEMINEEFITMVNRLKKHGVDYSRLKRALIPNQDKDNNEVCLVFDSSLIDSNWYGLKIYEKLLPVLDKESTYSILAGDYIDILENKESQRFLFEILSEVLQVCNDSCYQHNSQYFLIYINSITDNQLKTILEGLQEIEWFYGYALLNKNSRFKTYLSFILCYECIKAKDTVIICHPSDYSDDEIINMRGYPFEENGFKIVSINEESFGPFLSYKIEATIPDKEDISFAFNALFPKFDSMEKLEINLSDGKWGYLNSEQKGKGGILQSFSFEDMSKEEFATILYKHICKNYIYNLRVNEYGDYLFNVCVELLTRDGKVRKTTVALKYKPDCGQVDVVTIT